MGSIKAHLRYAGIGETDIAVLRAAKPLAEYYADAFVERFYGYLQEFEGTHAFIADPLVLKRLLDAQRRYLLSLFDAQFNSAYFEQRCLIGQTHFRIGLDFKWYVGAYGLYFNYFSPIFDDHFSNDATQRRAIQSAYQKVLLMDMAIVMESFHQRDKAALEMSKDQVLHQEKLATVGLLVSGLAHEIGNPLASIQAICDSQLRKQIEPPIAERFTRIRSQVTRIVNIVGQLINFARPAPAVWATVDINAVIESALEIARLARNAKSVEMKLSLDRSLPQIDALSEQLSQVFLNLFLNSMDAVGDQGGALEVTTSRQENYIVVKVRDNGCGISEENLSRIFEPFFTTKDVGKGTGLGLHVSLSIVDRHCGRIQCDSVVGSGTLFTISLPTTQRDNTREPA